MNTRTNCYIDADATAAPGLQQLLAPGFRFHPTDEELVGFYLANKIRDPNYTCAVVGSLKDEEGLYGSEPWELPGKLQPFKARADQCEWYLYSIRDHKYARGSRANRATKAGYWKATGKDHYVNGHASSTNYNRNGTTNSSNKAMASTRQFLLMGSKKTLVFYHGRAPHGRRTNWVMHEYRMLAGSGASTQRGEWVLCRVFYKGAGGKRVVPAASHVSLPQSLRSNSIVDAADHEQEAHESFTDLQQQDIMHDNSSSDVDFGLHMLGGYDEYNLDSISRNWSPFAHYMITNTTSTDVVNQHQFSVSIDHIPALHEIYMSKDTAADMCDIQYFPQNRENRIPAPSPCHYN